MLREIEHARSLPEWIKADVSLSQPRLAITTPGVAHPQLRGLDDPGDIPLGPRRGGADREPGGADRGGRRGESVTGRASIALRYSSC